MLGSQSSVGPAPTIKIRHNLAKHLKLCAVPNVDRGMSDALRAAADACPSRSRLRQGYVCAGDETRWDKFLTVLGRVGFLEGLAKFPVLYVDEDLTVFRFPPLGVNIAARRMS